MRLYQLKKEKFSKKCKIDLTKSKVCFTFSDVRRIENKRGKNGKAEYLKGRIMNRTQKIALYNLIVIVISLSFSAGAVTIMALTFGFPSAFAGFGFLAICIFTTLAPLFFRKDKQCKVEHDERDILIIKNSELTANNCSNIYFVLVSITALLVFGLNGTVSVLTLPVMIAGAYAISGLARSVSVLVQYGKGARGE